MEILLSMEGDGLRFDFTILDVDFVSTENDGDVFADTDEVTWKMLVGDRKGRVRCQLGTFL